jgi:ATP-dependent RNA helicase RhlE
VPKEIIAGFEPNPNERAEPIMRGRGQSPGPRSNARRDAPQKQRTAKPARPAQPGRSHSTHAGAARPAHGAPSPSHPARGPKPATAPTPAHKQAASGAGSPGRVDGSHQHPVDVADRPPPRALSFRRNSGGRDGKPPH